MTPSSFYSISIHSLFFVPGFGAEMAKWEAMKPVEDMCLEEMMDNCPELLDVNPEKPSFWPHDQDYDEWKAQCEKLAAEEGANGH